MVQMLKTTTSSHPPFAINGSSETVLMQSDTQNIAEDISLPLHDSDEENVTQKPDRYEVVPKPMVEMLKTTSSSHPPFAMNGSSETTVLMQSDTQNIAEDISLPLQALHDSDEENVTQKPDRYEVVPKPMVQMLKTTTSSHPPCAINGSSETVLMQSDTQNIAEDISLPLHDSDEENVTQKPDRYEVVPKPMVQMLKTTTSSHPPFAINGSSETVLMQSDTQNIAEDISLPLHDSDEENVTQKPDRYEVVPKPMVEMLKTTSSSHPPFAMNGSSETTVLMQSDTQNIAEDISLLEPSLIDFNLEPKTVPGSFMSNMCSSSTLIKQNSRINNSGISEIKYLCELMKSNEINFSDDSDSEIGNIFNSTISSLCNSKHSEITFDKVPVSPCK